MKKKIFGFAALGLLVSVLIYPGIPLGGSLKTTSSQSGGSTTITCRRLYLTGIDTKVIVMQHEPGAPIDVSNSACRSSP